MNLKNNPSQHQLLPWLIWVFYTGIVIFLVSRHEPWADEYKVWSMAYRLSIPELIGEMRVEGHFCLWHLLVYPFVRLLGMDWHAIYAVSVPLMSSTVWLILFKLDFNFWGKLLIIFSAPFLYHFPVIARCYALIPPILVTIAVLWQKKCSPFWFCGFVGLLAHTHAYMEGLVCALWCLFAYQYVIQIWHKDHQRALRNLSASVVTIFLVLLAFLQIAGSIVDANNGNGPGFSKISGWDNWIIYWAAEHRIRLFATLGHILPIRIPNLDMALTLALYVVFSASITLFIAKQSTTEQKEILWIIAIGCLFQVFFATNIYYMQFQRVYLFLFPVILILGMYYKKWLDKVCIMALCSLWLLNTPSQHIIAKDISNEYCFDVRNANEISKLLPEDAVLFCDDASCGRLIKRTIINGEPNEIEDSAAAVYLLTVSNSITAPLGYTSELLWNGIEGNSDITDIEISIPVYLFSIIPDAEAD